MMRPFVGSTALLLALVACGGGVTAPRPKAVLSTYRSWMLESVDGVPLPFTVDSSAASRRRLTQASITIDPMSANPIGPRAVSTLEVARTGETPAYSTVVDPLAYSVDADSSFAILGDSFVAGSARLRPDGSLVLVSVSSARYGAHTWTWRPAVVYPPD